MSVSKKKGFDQKSTRSHNSEGEEKTMEKDSFRSLKIGKTILFVMAWIGMGMAGGIDSPAIPDLRDNLGVSMEDISLALAFKSLGTPFGCILGGMVADRFRSMSDLIGSVSLIMLGSSSIGKPFAGTLVGLGSLSFLGGLGHGGIDAVGHGAIQWMWMEKSGPPMYAVHTGFPIGATVAPLIAQPFLSGENETETHPATTLSSLDDTSPSNQIEDDRLEIPYGIIGGYTLAVGLCLLIFFLFGCSRHIYRALYGKSKQSMKQVYSPQSFRAMGDTKYTVTILVLVCLFFAFVTGKDSTIDTFIFSYAIDSELQFTKDEASALTATYNAVGIAGRMLCIVIAKYCPPQPILIFCSVTTTLFAACIAFFGTQKDVYIWTFSILFKLTASPIWPCAITWAANYISFSALVVGFIQITASVAAFGSQWFSGYLYDTYGPEAHVYYGMACGMIMLVILTAMQLIGTFCKTKFAQETDDSIDKVNVKDIHVPEVEVNSNDSKQIIEWENQTQYGSTIELQQDFTRL